MTIVREVGQLLTADGNCPKWSMQGVMGELMLAEVSRNLRMHSPVFIALTMMNSEDKCEADFYYFTVM